MMSNDSVSLAFKEKSALIANSSINGFPCRPKKRGKCKLFELDKVFDTPNIEISENWSKKFRNSTLNGPKQYYYCNKSKKCPAEMYLFYRYDGLIERHTFGKHSHHDEDEATTSGKRSAGSGGGGSNDSRSKLAENVKSEILRLFENGTTKPNLIQQNLRKKGYLIKDSQLYVFLNRYKRTKSFILGAVNIKQLCNHKSS